MPKMKIWDGSQWVVLDAKDSDTVDGKHASDFSLSTHNHALASLSEKNYSSLVGRPADDDFHMLSTATDAAVDDELPIYDVSSGTYKKIAKGDLFRDTSSTAFIRYQEEFTATDGQTVFNLTKGSYRPGFGMVDVYIWGVKQPPTSYTESSSTSITLNQAVEAGTKVLIDYIRTADVVSVTAVPHAATHASNGVDPVTPAMIGAETPSGAQTKVDTHANSTQSHGISGGYYIAKTSRSDQLPAWNDIQGKPSTFQPSAHKSSHAIGGSDALTPADIGALNKAGDTMTGALSFKKNSVGNPQIVEVQADRIDVGFGGTGGGNMEFYGKDHATAPGEFRVVFGGGPTKGAYRIYHYDGTSWIERVTILPDGTAKINNYSVWHAGNDGTGSGLDADLIDGVHLSSLPQLSAVNTFTGTNLFKPSNDSTTAFRVQKSDASAVFNVDTTNKRVGILTESPSYSLDVSGIGKLSNLVVITTGDRGISISGTGGYSIVADAIGEFPGWSSRLYINTYSNSGAKTTTRSAGVEIGGPLFVRGEIYNGETTTNKYWHAGNDGSGSGLDADLIDGKHLTDLVQNISGVPSIQAGTDDSKPAAGTVGRLYIATDTKKLYRDTGSSWDTIGGSAGGDADTVDGKHASDFLLVTGGTINGSVTVSGSNSIIFGGRFRISYNNSTDSLDITVVA